MWVGVFKICNSQLQKYNGGLRCCPPPPGLGKASKVEIEAGRVSLWKKKNPPFWPFSVAPNRHFFAFRKKRERWGEFATPGTKPAACSLLELDFRR